ncbi:Acetyltransferase (GNAT) family protein [Bosea sp. CRIB-10]|uniref:GNAT family N-acetyltransferase n=1 Tax=Bosea sp. CRIB-10 TaxID=378404 RepID=UPI0008E5C9EF|nr:GNAT family N-acetyltransferase [Bosea sp. CRIB-10]SFC54810.1 Acetyltransferase (GNAT) family protein [Bosea sp. CRIB-10]
MTKTAALSGVTMREARRDDAARIAWLIMQGSATQTRSDAEIAQEAAHPSYLDAFDEVAASPYNTLFVAELDGEVVGTLQVTLIPGLINRGRKRAKLESVHVDPALRGRRIGEAMVAHAVDFARKNGAGLVELTSNKAREAAHRFYRRLGFDQSHEGFKLEL